MQQQKPHCVDRINQQTISELTVCDLYSHATTDGPYTGTAKQTLVHLMRLANLDLGEAIQKENTNNKKKTKRDSHQSDGEGGGGCEERIR